MKNVAVLGATFEIDAYTIAKYLNQSSYKAYAIMVDGSTFNYNGIQIDKNDFSLTLDGEKINFDVIFNTLEAYHLESYFDMLGIPCANCNRYTAMLLANKFFAEKVIGSLGLINVPKSISLYKNKEYEVEEIVKKFEFPILVKPVDRGFSIGINKVNSIRMLISHNKTNIESQKSRNIKKMNSKIVPKTDCKNSPVNLN